jgi:VanZ family protein
MAIIFWLSSQPAPALGGIEIPDKAAHFALYGALGALLWWAAAPLGMGAAAALAIAICGFYGVSDELHQRLVPTRTGDVRDWVADIGGAAAAVIVAALLVRRGSRRRSSESR